MAGIYGKYKIEKADGTPVDPKAIYFTLRLDTDPYARAAIRAYIEACREEQPELASAAPLSAGGLKRRLVLDTPDQRLTADVEALCSGLGGLLWGWRVWGSGTGTLTPSTSSCFSTSPRPSLTSTASAFVRRFSANPPSSPTDVESFLL